MAALEIHMAKCSFSKIPDKQRVLHDHPFKPRSSRCLIFHFFNHKFWFIKVSKWTKRFEIRIVKIIKIVYYVCTTIYCYIQSIRKSIALRTRNVWLGKISRWSGLASEIAQSSALGSVNNAIAQHVLYIGYTVTTKHEK